MMRLLRDPVPAKFSYNKLASTAEWKSFKEVCKKNTDLQSWDTNLKERAEEIAKSLKAGGGLSIDSLKQLTLYVSQSNTKTVHAILEFKEDTTKGKGSSTKKKKNEERVNMLADEYMKNSSNMLDFLSEMEKFLTLARNSHSSITSVIEKYFKIHNGMRGRAEYYRMIADNLKKLRDSDNTFDHSAENLLKKAVSLKIQHEEMLQKLQGEFIKLCKKEKRLKSWENVVLMIFVGAMVGLAIAGILTAVIAAPSVATAIAAGILPITMAGHWSITWFDESAKAFKYEREVNEARREETRVSIKELGNIKSSIDGVITQINSVMYNPSSAMDREQIDFTMKAIRSKLGAFLNKVKDLERDVEKARREIRTARDDVHITGTHVKKRSIWFSKLA